MAFNGVGLVFLNSGAATWAGVNENVPYNSDNGAQWIMAHPEMNKGFFPQFGTAIFQVDQFQKQIDFSADTGEQYVTYWTFVTNAGAMNTFFSMQGGGNV
jgi:hypothetical protein